MATVVEEIRLILSDVKENSNKWWTGKLFDDGTVITEWGRVGKDSQSKNFGAVGKSFLEKKHKEKLKKGYTQLKLATGGVTNVVHHNLADIAKRQIKINNPELEKLIERLAKENVHNITSSTRITYDNKTGLFSTPLGIVTLDAIKDARDLLLKIKTCVESPIVSTKSKNKFFEYINQYLRLVPQDVGMKLDAYRLFPDAQSIVKQNDILDSLEVSFNSLQSSPTQKTEATEQLFSVSLHILEDQRDCDRIIQKYNRTKSDAHVSRHLKVKKIYKVLLENMAKSFDSKVGNIMELWHGTKTANLLSIFKAGLKLSPPNTVALTGKLFGNGIYFSDQATKSLNYSYGYWTGTKEPNCFMFLASVAMGKHYTPRSYGSRYGGNERFPMSGYDSTFAKGGESGVLNNEMIVYSENRCNLTYLVEFA